MRIAEELSAARFIIRKYDDLRGCQSVEELSSVLMANCMDDSVTVHYTRTTGLIATLFVDVAPQGVIESYGQQQPVDWAAIDAQALHVESPAPLEADPYPN